MKSREEKLVKLFNSLIIQFTFGIAQDDERFLGFVGFSSHPQRRTIPLSDDDELLFVKPDNIKAL